MRSLSEMTLEELWELFPIFLAEHRAEWDDFYREMETKLKNAFRDFLNEHFKSAKEYEALKLDLWKRYEHDRDSYTAAKTEFVLRCTGIARKLYGDRYPAK